MGRVCLIVFLVSACMAASARGQLPPGGSTDSRSLRSPADEALAYNANPSRTGEASEEDLFGPLQRIWLRDFEHGTNQPLIIGRRVIVNVALPGDSGSRVLALDADTGTTRWAQRLPGPFPSAPLAADGETIISVGREGVVRAFAAADGDLLWSKPLPRGADPVTASPVAADGSVYVWASNQPVPTGSLYALRVSDGRLQWSWDIDIEPHGDPAIDNARVFVVNSCGSAYAVYRESGLPAWSRSGTQCLGEPTIVSGGRLFAGLGETYAAVTGLVRDDVPERPDAVAAGAGFLTDGNVASAFDLASSQELWSVDLNSSGQQILAPLAVEDTIYVADPGRILSIERASGQVLTAVSAPGGNWQGWDHPGLAAGANVLALAIGTDVAAYEPVLQPSPRGLAIAATGLDVLARTEVGFAAGVGREIKPRRDHIAFERDPAPDGGWEQVSRKPQHDDGTAYFNSSVPRNTRYRATLEDGTESPQLRVFAYPRYRLGARAVSRKYAVLRAVIRRIPAREIAGMTMFGYFGDSSRRSYNRLGSTHLRAKGDDAVKGSIRFRIPRQIGRNDVIAVCVDRLPEAGWGRNIGFAKRCGQHRIAYGEAKANEVAKTATIPNRNADRESICGACRPAAVSADF